jgi:integrase
MVRDSASTSNGPMTASLPYIRNRDGVFQYERRVPLHVQRDAAKFGAAFGGRPLFRRSLRTKRREEAVLAYGLIDEQFEALLLQSRAVRARQAPERASPQRTVTDHDLAVIAKRYEGLTAEPFERLHRQANVCPTAAAELERLEAELEIDAEAIRVAVRGRGNDSQAIVPTPMAEADALIEELGFLAPPGSEDRGAVICAVRSGLERGYSRITALSTGEAAPKVGRPLEPLSSANGMTLARAVDQYIEARKPSVKASSETRLALRQFEQVVGRKALGAICRDDIYKFVAHLSNLVVGGRTAESVARPLSEQSIRKRLRMLSAVVNFARDRSLFDGDNMFSGVRVTPHVKPVNKAIMPDKRRLRVSELNAIFTHPWFTGCEAEAKPYRTGTHRLAGSQFWVPIVALFTGCRAGELGGMKLSEVRLHDPHPHLIVRDNEYRRTKGKRARCVPVLDALLAIGFAEYVAGIDRDLHDRLFPDWTAPKRKGGTDADDPAWSNSGVVRAFNRNVIPATLGENLPTGARREVTFHSLRGAFKAMLAVSPNVQPIAYDEVVGHKQSDLNQRYIGEVTIEETYPMIRHCNFKGLNLPSAPPI